MTPEFLTRERKRFADVMAARTTDWDLLELFKKLAVSKLFADAVKPYCYADLITAASRRIKDEEVPFLLKAVERTGAARMVREVLSKDEADVVLRQVVRRAFLHAPREEGPLMEVFLWCERTGIAPERGHTLALAIEAKMDMDDLDTICDLTHDAYYPTLRSRRAEALALAA